MDCQTCNDLLLDLAYGELDDVRAAAVRRHIEGCAECGAAWRRVERGRALAKRLEPEPVPDVSTLVHGALRAALAAQPNVALAGGSADASGTFAAPKGPESAVVRGPARWFERVGELAMRRQVAMAAVFLVMIGVGLIFYQSHPRPTDVTEDRRPDVVPAVEVSAGTGETRAGVVPAMHLGEREEAHTHNTAASHHSAVNDEARPPAPLRATPSEAAHATAPPREAEAQAQMANQNEVEAPPAPSPSAVAPPPPAPTMANDVGSIAAGDLGAGRRGQVQANAPSQAGAANGQAARVNLAQETQAGSSARPASVPAAVTASLGAAGSSVNNTNNATNNDLPSQRAGVPASTHRPARRSGGRAGPPADSMQSDLGL